MSTVRVATRWVSLGRARRQVDLWALARALVLMVVVFAAFFAIGRATRRSHGPRGGDPVVAASPAAVATAIPLSLPSGPAIGTGHSVRVLVAPRPKPAPVAAPADRVDGRLAPSAAAVPAPVLRAAPQPRRAPTVSAPSQTPSGGSPSAGSKSEGGTSFDSSG